MPDFAVDTVFGGKPKGVLQAFKDMIKGANRFERGATNAFKQASRSAKRFQSITKSILKAGAVQKGLGLLQQGVASLGMQFIDFDQAIISSTAKFKDVTLGTEESKKAMMDLKKAARDVGAATQFSAAEAAGGLDFLAMAGFESKQAIAALPGVVDLATVANVDLARSTDIASDALGAFGLMTEKPVQLQRNFARLNDVMSKTMTSTNTDIEQLFETLKFAGPAFTVAGQELEDFAAIAGRMAANGIKATNSGTALRAGIIRLAAPPKKARAAIAQLGLQIKDNDGNMRNIIDIIKQLEEKTKGMGNTQKAAALDALFGKNAFSAWAAVINEGTGELVKLQKEIKGSQGATLKMAEFMRGSVKNKLATLKSAVIELGLKFITAFQEQGVDAIESITKFIQKIDVKPLVAAIKTAIEIFKVLFSIIRPFIPLMPALVAGMLAYNAAIKAQAALGAARMFFTMMKATKGMAAAQAILNVVMSMNPIGLIVAAIAVLITLYITFRKRIDDAVKSSAKGNTFFKTMKRIFDAIGKAVKAIFKLLGPLFNILKPIFSFLGTVIGTVLKPLAFMLEVVADGLENTLGKLEALLSGDFGKMIELAVADLPVEKGQRKAAAAKVKEFFGVDEKKEKVIPPNRAEVTAKSRVDLEGRIEIAGAPKGTTASAKVRGATGKINMQGLGVNP